MTSATVLTTIRARLRLQLSPCHGNGAPASYTLPVGPSRRGGRGLFVARTARSQTATRSSTTGPTRIDGDLSPATDRDPCAAGVGIVGPVAVDLPSSAAYPVAAVLWLTPLFEALYTRGPSRHNCPSTSVVVTTALPARWIRMVHVGCLDEVAQHFHAGFTCGRGRRGTPPTLCPVHRSGARTGQTRSSSFIAGRAHLRLLTVPPRATASEAGHGLFEPTLIFHQTQSDARLYSAVIWRRGRAMTVSVGILTQFGHIASARARPRPGGDVPSIADQLGLTLSQHDNVACRGSA